ncbi:MAG: flavin reductase family protein [Rhizobiales bacterium]|nr:flavin reductase family protein [Hyphomicrobiales bacterium]
MFYDAIRNDHGFAVDPIKAIVAPRPIGWISTISETGVNNLAPYSFFNLFSDNPSYVAFGSGGRKDSLTNISASGEFAVNLATFDLREQMNASSAEVPAHVDEFELARLTAVPCRFIKCNRVGESPAVLECRHFKTIDLPNDDGHVDDFLVIGRVVGVHIDDRFIHDGRVDTAALKPLGRLGYAEYATVENIWRMRRPG